VYTLKKTRVISEIKRCLDLAIPLAGAQLAQSLVAFIDTMMMGWLGSGTIAAGGLGAATFNVFLITGISIVSAVSPLTAEAYGAGQTKQVGRVVRQGFWVALTFALPITLLLWSAEFFLRRLGQAPETVALTETYLQAIAWGYFPALGFAVLRSYISSLSRTRPIIVVIIGGTILNIVGNYVLMLGKLGFPALGLAGIGWASTISLWSTFLALGLYALLHPQLRIYRAFSHLHQFEPAVYWDLLRVGLPIGILAIAEAGLFTVTTFLMGQISTVTLAAHQIALQTAATSFMIPLGVSFATTIRVGQMLGQGDRSGARLAGYVGMGIGATFMAAMGLLMWTIPERIVSLYLDTSDPVNADVVTVAKNLLGVAAWFQLVDGIQVTANGALRGLKDTYIPMMIGIVAYWGIGLTSGYVLSARMGLGGVGLWWGLAIGLAIAAIVLTWRFSTARLEPAIVPCSKPLA
jgi:multidrug resistance protein, MATE family